MDINKPKVSAIIQVYNPNIITLLVLIKSLQNQTIAPYEIILVDSSPSSLKDIPMGIHYHKVIDNGVAYACNQGASYAKGEYLLFIQDDCLPEYDFMIELMLQRLISDKAVAVVPIIHLPKKIFNTYDFWGKSSMINWIGDRKQGISVKFDIIKKEVFNSIGGFDDEHFRYGGEDIDLYIRLTKVGKVVQAYERVIHNHYIDNKFSPKDLDRKIFLLGQSFGAQVRKHGINLFRVPHSKNISQHLTKLAFLFIPFLFIHKYMLFVFISLCQFINLRMWKLKDHRIMFLPFENFFWVFTNLAGTLSGLFKGQVSYSRNKHGDEYDFWNIVIFFAVILPAIGWSFYISNDIIIKYLDLYH